MMKLLKQNPFYQALAGVVLCLTMNSCTQLAGTTLRVGDRGELIVSAPAHPVVIPTK